MLRTSRQVVVVGVSLLLAAAMGLFVVRSKSDTATLAFWFESISEDAMKTLPDRLAGGISPDDMTTIEKISRDVQSYEHGSANRREQYYGEMRWDIAAPMLKQKFGLK